ncbi:hypothetical protein KVR01_009080 [Diaporthe batatas]|uniref:uncharacterized protein n=1 Tax=Diaporthe batatas TaxID=748121 RepID=UPI001D052F28|nr:uncharacterized protein KVR01_009080 [Diaporthe batatas]KAG8160816.1 hypothetical protein KVR01_009080 [Diaporthe batatas]
MANQQPSNIEPYIQPSNPITKEPLENKVADNRARDNSSAQGNVDVPSERSQEGTFSSLGSGVQGGSGPVDATEARSTGSMGSGAAEQLQNPNVNAEQLATFSEGKVADAVQRKSGIQKAPDDGEVKYDDYASDLDRKKAEQAAARDDIKAAREAGVDVDGGSAGGNVRGAVQVD